MVRQAGTEGIYDQGIILQDKRGPCLLYRHPPVSPLF